MGCKERAIASGRIAERLGEAGHPAVVGDGAAVPLATFFPARTRLLREHAAARRDGVAALQSSGDAAFARRTVGVGETIAAHLGGDWRLLRAGVGFVSHRRPVTSRIAWVVANRGGLDA
jgi:hypothetical protein